MPSFGFCGQCTHVVHIHTYTKITYTHKIKIKKWKEEKGGVLCLSATLPLFFHSEGNIALFSSFICSLTRFIWYLS